jgi:hypothetical protein
MDCSGRTRWLMLVDQLKEDQMIVALPILITAIVLFAIAIIGKKAEATAEDLYNVNFGFGCLYAIGFVLTIIFG